MFRVTCFLAFIWTLTIKSYNCPACVSGGVSSAGSEILPIFILLRVDKVGTSQNFGLEVFWHSICVGNNETFYDKGIC